jgi:hypothetical protein
MQPDASALVTASAQLLEDLASGRRPLASVSESLAGLAIELDVEKVTVAIDDAVYGRQVFTSGRTPLGERGDLLIGPARTATDPPRPLDDALDRLIVASVAASFERARAGQAPVALARETRAVESSVGGLVDRLRAATDRSTRYGWGFTLVVLHLDHADERSTRRLEAHLRAGDTLVEISPREYGILLPAAGGDEVPRLLARVGRDGAVSTFCYGLAACPGDATAAAELLDLATSRLSETKELRAGEARATANSGKTDGRGPDPRRRVHALEERLV